MSVVMLFLKGKMENLIFLVETIRNMIDEEQRNEFQCLSEIPIESSRFKD